MNDIGLARVYDASERSEHEVRVLVDRLWPRGLAKADADLDEWCKDVAPSTELRRWYGHVVDRFEEFRERYERELDESPASDAFAHLESLARTHTLTLLTATRDVEHSAARVVFERLTGAPFIFRS